MEPITLSDLTLINSLSSRTYTGNSLLSRASIEEKLNLNAMTKKLKTLAEYFSQKYTDAYGPFGTCVTTGNHIAIGGTRFKRVWSGIYKGAPNKQYAAQVSFVMNPQETCLDVGFYFGRASGHDLTKDEKKRLELQLKSLGMELSNAISNNNLIQEKYHSLFDFGFQTFSNGQTVSAIDWCNIIKTKTSNSQIVGKIYPNDFGVIENSTIDLYVSQVIFLMGAIQVNNGPQQIMVKPLTPEQRAKEAERLAQIGQKGEIFVMQYEQDKLKSSNMAYPKHVALDSMHYGYDILSLDVDGEEIYIEVKTTTRSKEDPYSRSFFISNNEYNLFLDNKKKHRLYRVYSVESDPCLEILDLRNLEANADGYIIKY